jgi:hypothetical protein
MTSFASSKKAPRYVPRPERWECDAEIVVADECGRELHGRLANISEAGFMAECEEKLPVGAIVQVVLPDRGEVRAEVRWALGWKFGAVILDF